MTNLSIWVTSKCNLSCKWCVAKYTKELYKDYEMPIEEINDIVNSCKRRNLYFDVIDLTGGEPSLWTNIREGVKLFGEISDEVILTTNGNNPSLIKSLGLKTIILSSSQSTADQLKEYGDTNMKIYYNAHQHKKPPIQPVPNSLPAICSRLTYMDGRPQRKYIYVKGNVYECCCLLNLGDKIDIKESAICDFEDDFITKLNNIDFNDIKCSYCLSNLNVWNAL